ATPHVAGLVAYLIGKNGNSSPASIAALVKSLSVKGVLTGIRAYPFFKSAARRGLTRLTF
ncbi:hypothetical protein DXG03_007478, partial [Asterophora parasitica]